MNRSLSFFLGLLFLSIHVGAQKPPLISVTVDHDKILLGEQFDLLLDARYSDLGTVSFFEVDSLPHFEIIAKSKIDTALVDNDIILSQKITLTSFDSGRWQIPSLALAKSKTVSKPIVMTVSFSSPFDPKQDYHDIKDITNVPTKLQSNWYWYLLAAIVLIAILLLLFPGKKEKVEEKIEETDVFNKALANLKKISDEHLAEKDDKAFYVAIVDVFRWYLNKGKGIQSYSKTSHDLALQIKSLDVPADVFSKLVEVLQISDAVKFAKFHPSPEENQRSLIIIKTAIEVIESK